MGGRTLVVDIGSFCPQKKEHVSLPNPQYSAFKNENEPWENHGYLELHCMALSYPKVIGNIYF